MQELKNRFSKALEFMTSERFFYYYIIFVMISLPIFEIFEERHSHCFVAQQIIVEMAGYLGIFVFLTHFIIHKNIKYYMSDLLYFFLFIFAILSAVFSQNKYNTWHGFNYDEWPFNFVGYFSLMLAGTMICDKQLRKNILKAFVAVTCIQSVVAALQTVGIYSLECYYKPDLIMENKMCYGLTQNSNWYGGLSVILFACTAGLYLYTNNNTTKKVMYAISMLCFYTLIGSEARLAWVGVFGFVTFIIVSFRVMKKKEWNKEKMSDIMKRFYILLAGMTVVIIFSILVFGRIISRLDDTMDELNGANDGLGSNRLYLWKHGLKAFPKYWAFGIGLDNFEDVFFKDPDFKGGFTNGKAHNEYIHYLVTQGIFQFITYITLLVYTAKTGVRNVIKNDDEEERLINWVLLGMFFAYVAQAFFNSSIVYVVPYFWITIGMCLCQKNQRCFVLKAQKAAK